MAAVFAGSARAVPGDLDPSFGGIGWVRTDFDAFDDETIDMALQPDGKAVVVARSEGRPDSIALARYNPDGGLDPSFSADGRVNTAWSDEIRAYPRAVALTPDGKIVVVGEAESQGFAVARYNPDGSLDKTFSGDGKLLTPFEGSGVDATGWATAVTVQPDGKIVASGSTNSTAAIARYNPDGSLDKTFSGDGKATTSMDLERAFRGDLVVQPDGKILMLQGEIARYLPDGSLDPTFSGNGIIEGETAELPFLKVFTIQLQPDGKIVAAGDAGGEYDSKFGVARFLPDGSLDPSFAGDGSTDTAFFDEANVASATAAVLQPDGKIVLAGNYAKKEDALYADDTELALARYLPDGALDYNFGSGGIQTIDLTEKDDTVDAMALQPNGHFLLAGSTAEPTSVEDHRPGDVLVARVEGGTLFIPARPTIRGRPGRARVSKRRTFRLKTVVSCPGAGPACKVRVKVRAKARKRGRLRAIQVGGGRFTIPAGGSRRLKARLSPRGMGLLRARGRLVVLVRVRVARGESSVSKALRATLLPPARPKRKR